MNLFAMMETSGGAMSAERMRAEVVAANMANAETTRTATGGPYHRSMSSSPPMRAMRSLPAPSIRLRELQVRRLRRRATPLQRLCPTACADAAASSGQRTEQSCQRSGSAPGVGLRPWSRIPGHRSSATIQDTRCRTGRLCLVSGH